MCIAQLNLNDSIVFIAINEPTLELDKLHFDQIIYYWKGKNKVCSTGLCLYYNIVNEKNLVESAKFEVTQGNYQFGEFTKLFVFFIL